jgi:hypothetical protein
MKHQKDQRNPQDGDVQVRSIARQLARELTQEELDAVSGGSGGNTWSGTGAGGVTDDADILH